MKKKILRALSIGLLIIFCIGIFTVTVNAADSDEKIRSGDFDYYVLPDGTIRLDGYYGGDEILEIPAYLDGYEVSAIGRYGAQWFFNEPVDGVFNHMKTKSIKLPETVVNFAYDTSASCFGNWITLENIYVDEGNPNFKSENGIFYNKNMTELLFYPEGKKDTVYILPDSVNTIAHGAINRNDYLEKVYLGKQVSSIADFTFEMCPSVFLYVYDNTYGLDWAVSHGFNYVIIDEPQTPVEKELVNSQTGIQVSGLMHPDAVLNVKSVENTVQNAVSTFDITLVKDGNIIQPDGTITISIPSEHTGCKVFWVKDDGTKVDMNAEYKDGNYVFTTDHLSIYALVKESDTTEPEPTETILEYTEKPTSEQTVLAEETTTKVYPTASTNPTSKISTTDTATKDSTNKGTAAISNNKGNSDNGTIQTGAISIAVILFVVLASLATGGFVWYRRKIK